MKTAATLLILFALCLLNIYAQDVPQWDLPDGATAHLGKSWVSDMQYSPEGTRLEGTSSIGAWLYDANTHQELALLTGHTAGVTSGSFSSDGDMLASGSEDDTVLFWEVAPPMEPERELPPPPLRVA